MAQNVTFNRIYRILVGIRHVNGSFITNSVIGSPLHMELNVDESYSSSGTSFNPCKLNLYSISPEAIAALNEENASIRVHAGYSDVNGIAVPIESLSRIYEGDIVKSDSQNDNQGNKVTTVTCQEGWFDCRDSMITGTEITTVGTPYDGFIRDRLAFHTGYPIDIHYREASDKVVKKSGSYHGKWYTAMDTVIDKASNTKGKEVISKLCWFYHRGRVHVTDLIPTNASLSEVFNIHIIPRSRIKDSITAGSDSSEYDGYSPVGLKTIKFRMYLEPEVSLGDVVELEPSARDSLGGSQYIVTGLNTQLSLDGDRWDSVIKGRLLG